jgi:hypothetical protein
LSRAEKHLPNSTSSGPLILGKQLARRMHSQQTDHQFPRGFSPFQGISEHSTALSQLLPEWQ